MLSTMNAEPEAPGEPLPITLDPNASATELVDAFVAESEWWSSRPLRVPPSLSQTGAGRLILKLDPDQQRAVLFEALRRSVAVPLSTTVSRPYALIDCATLLFLLDLGFTET